MAIDDPKVWRETQKALGREFPHTEEGFAEHLHYHLYFRFISLYVYYMKAGINAMLPEPEELIKPKGIDYEIVDEMVKLAVNKVGHAAGSVKTNVYHAKVVTLDHAEQVLSLKEDLDLGSLPKTIMPYEHAVDAVIKNPESIAVVDCACRSIKKGGCRPLDVCLLIGEPWVSWVLARDTHMNARKITQEEALKILRETHERGNVHAVFFKDASAGRIYSICNCCSCCCTALQAQNYVGAPMMAGSGYKARIDAEKCVGCGMCSKKCNFNAIEMQDGKPAVNDDLCMGCEGCMVACKKDAISMELVDPEAPFDIKVLKEKQAK